MKESTLIILTLALFLFTVSAFSLTIIKHNIIFLPFAVLGLVLMITFKIKLKEY